MNKDIFKIFTANKMFRYVVGIASIILIFNLVNYVIESNIIKTKLAPRLVRLLALYKAYDVNGEINLIRLGKNADGGYLAPELALKDSDALFGYGILDDISFEEEFSKNYGKHSFGFDCGVENVNITNNLTHFIHECIATDNFVYDAAKYSNISSFSQQIEHLKLEGKKIFIKMDIEGGEYDAFKGILDNSDLVPGIVMELHVDKNVESFNQAIFLLSGLNEKFYLLNIHGNNCADYYFTASNVRGRVPLILQLTYINKNLVKSARVSDDQSHPSKKDMPNCPRRKDEVFEILLDNL
jgi:hypothetical protein